MNAGAQERAAATRLAAIIAASRRPPAPRPSVARDATPRAVNERIAVRLAWVRGCAGLTRRELAMFIAVGEPASLEQRLWRYETCRAATPAALLVRLAEIFDVSVETFTSERFIAAERHTRVRRDPAAVAQLLKAREPGRALG